MGLKDNHVAAWSGGLLTLKLSDEAPGRSCGGPNKIFRPQTPFEMQREFTAASRPNCSV